MSPDVEKVDIQKLYNGLLHAPKAKGSTSNRPLYTLSDEGSDGPEGQEEIRFMGTNIDEAWKTASQHSYNSPTNIRRIVITKKWVAVEYFIPMIINDAPSSNGCWRKVMVPHTLDKAIIAEYNEYMQLRQRPRKLIISGDIGMGTKISSPWSLSNLEEIIVDEVSLLSFLGRGKVGLDVAILNSIIGQADYAKTAQLALFGIKSVVNIIESKYKRLRCLSYVPNLGAMIDIATVSSYKGLEHKPLVDNMIKKGLFGPDKALIFRPKRPIIDTGDLIIRRYYRFDRERLQPYVRKFTKLLQDSREQEREGTDSEDTSESKTQEAGQSANPSPVNTLMPEVAKEIGDNNAKVALKIALASLNKEDRDYVLSRVDKKWGGSL